MPLSPISVFVGSNNSGKSNVVRALQLLSTTFARGSIDAAITEHGGPDALFTKGGTRAIELGVKARFGNAEIEYEVGTVTAARHGLERLRVSGIGPQSFSVARDSKGNFSVPFNMGSSISSPGWGVSATCQDSRAAPEVRQFYDFIAAMKVADFSIDALKRPSVGSPNAELGRSGDNLAGVLDRLYGEHPTVRREIDAEVHSAIPSIDSVVTVLVDGAGQKVIGIAEGENVFRAEHISDGILFFIGLSTVAQMSRGRALVSMEEPEKGIHPRRIREMLDQVRRVVRKGSQVLMTTHSPVLLNEFRDEPESVVVLERNDRGPTTLSRLSDRPTLLEELKTVSLGDLWFSGILGGVPSK